MKPTKNGTTALWDLLTDVVDSYGFIIRRDPGLSHDAARDEAVARTIGFHLISSTVASAIRAYNEGMER